MTFNFDKAIADIEGFEAEANEARNGHPLKLTKPARKPKGFESVTYGTDPLSAAVIRVFRTHETLPDETQPDILIAISKIPSSATMQEVLDLISTLPNIVRIELFAGDGNGLIAYYE